MGEDGGDDDDDDDDDDDFKVVTEFGTLVATF